MSEERPARRLHIEPSDLVLEIISIVIAIVLATAVGQLVDYYRSQANTHEALGQVCREIADGDAQLRAVQPLHTRIRGSFVDTVAAVRGERLDFAAFIHAFARPAPHGFRPFNGSTTAWDVARASNVFANVPYGLRAAMQRRYAETANLTELNAAFLAHLEAAPTDARPNFYFSAIAITLILGDIEASEARLLDADDAALNGLRSASMC